MLMLFGLSSNKHVIKYFFGSTAKEYVYLLESDSEGKKETSEKQETEKKDKCDFYLSHSDFSFNRLLKQKLESLHKENSDIHVFKPQSPPPETFLI